MFIKTDLRILGSLLALLGILWLIGILAFAIISILGNTIDMPPVIRSLAYALSIIIAGVLIHPIWSKKILNINVDIRILGLITVIWLLFIKELQIIAFRIFAFDYGYFLSVLHNTIADGAFCDSIHQHSVWAEHFSPILYAIAPLSKFVSPIHLLAILQSGALALGLFLIMWFTYGKTKKFPLIIFILLLFNPFFNHIHRFDFHPEALAFPLVVIVFWMIEKGVKKLFDGILLALFCIAIGIMKEDALILLGGLCIFALMNKRYKEVIIVGAVTIAMFMAIWSTTFQYPEYIGFVRYGGETTSGFIIDILSAIPRLFSFQRIKTLLLLLASVGFAPIFFPKFLIAIIPHTFAHLSSPYFEQYTLKFQYTAFILPPLLYTFAKKKPLNTMAILCVLISIWMFFPRYIKPSTPADWKASREALKVIPEGSSVMTTSNFYPYLVGKANVHCINDKELKPADYYLLNLKYGYFPLDKTEILKLNEKLESIGELVYDSENVKLYKLRARTPRTRRRK